ncbi:MAG: Type II secretion system protein G precursor [Spirochaetes bacterium ADurb.Bin269]|nr:MAG: Type II secretion system protein G precursor [Spirochaetes bacterium ADurb.Bin269]
MNSRDPGYSFLETLIVLAITIIMSAGVGIPALRHIERARRASARTGIETFRLALDSYYIDCGMYPETMQGLSALVEKPVIHPVPEHWNGPYLTRPPGKDPWGTEWQYTKPGSNGYPFEILSYGKNGIEGGDGDDLDIASNN